MSTVKLLYGTGNQAKLSAMRSRLKKLGIELIGLNDLKMDENHIYEAMDPSMESEKFLLTDVPHSAIRQKGFPLDSMSIEMKTGKYYYDLAENELEQFAVEDGVLRFFEKILNERSTDRL